jgi:phenylacetate-CoA ligase
MINHDINWIDLPNAQRALPQAIQFQLSQTQRFDTDRMSNIQLNAIKHLLNECKANVPFYKMDCRYQVITCWQDFLKLPILNRETLQSNHENLINQGDLSKHGNVFEFKSSGSTGRPVHVLSTERANLYWQAFTLREHLWQQRDFDSKMAIIKFLPTGQAMYPGEGSPNWGPASSMFNTGPCLVLNSSETLDKQMAWLKHNKPDYLLCYPSILNELAKYNLLSEEKINLKGISTFGENVNDSTRSLVKKAFNCKVNDMYSAQEIGYMALQCPKHDHYHTQSENCLVEILNDENKPCEPGELGKVVVTAFHNFKMPLIRYAIGDYAIAGEPCDCGIKLPTIKKIIGRTRNLLTYPNGKKSWPAYNPVKLMELIDNAQFQLTQISLNTILFNVKTNDNFSTELERNIVSTLQTALGYKFNIKINKVNEISRSKSGKFEEFFSEL